MNLRFLRSRRLGWLAVLGPAIALGSIFLAISQSPWFSWQDNAVSDLGVSDMALLFNSSLIICGLACAVFAFGVLNRLESLAGRTGFFIMLLASISLMGIGIFSEDYSPHHFIFSVLFFVLLLLASLVLGFHFLRKRRTSHLGIMAVFVAILGIAGWAYHSYVGFGEGVAIPEALSFVPGGAWFMMLGLHVLKKKPLDCLKS